MARSSSQLPTPLRKAAILISALEPPDADKLLDQMGEQQAARVRNAILHLEDVDPAEQQQVIEDFLHGGRKPAGGTAGVELHVSWAAREATREEPNGLRTPEPARRFHILRDVESPALAKFLHSEHPQTVAIVLAHLPATLAAEVLGNLEAELQTEVLRRIAESGETDPEILRDLEQQIEVLLSSQLRTVRRTTVGMATVEAILASVGGGQRDAILRNLTDHDAHLAQMLTSPNTSQHAVPDNAGQGNSTPAATPIPVPGPPTVAEGTPVPPPAPSSPTAGQQTTGQQTTGQRPTGQRPTAAATARHSRSGQVPEDAAATHVRLEFQDLERLDDPSLAAVLRGCDPRAVLLALTGANQQLVARLLKQLPPRDAKALQNKLKYVGPLRLTDIERAQELVADVARRMTAEGLIGSLRPERLLAAA